MRAALKDETAMRNYCRLFFAVLAAVALQSQGAYAQDDDDDDDDGDARDRTCTSSFDDERVNGTLNVVGRCQLDDTDVRGDVLVFAGGALIARSSRIRGDLDASRADFVDLDDVRVDGDVELRELVGDSSRIESSVIGGNVALTGNRSRFEILDNELNRDLRASGNTGGLRIAGNSIGDDLVCSGNAPAPTLVGNRIEGEAEGQCASTPPELEPPEEPPPRAEPPAPSPPPPAPRPPAASPPPATPAPPPPSTPAPPATPPPAAPAPPAAAAPPEPPPAAATPPAAEPALIDDGGAGALGWPAIALLLPLIAWRRLRSRRSERTG
jgi:hypothetical protein